MEEDVFLTTDEWRTRRRDLEKTYENSNEKKKKQAHDNFRRHCV